MATVKTISGISDFTVTGDRTCGDNIQFPTVSGSTLTFNKAYMPVSGSVTYNQTTTRRESMISQQGNNIGFTESFVPPFIEGEFYLTYIGEGANAVEITYYLTQQVDVTVTVTTRGGKRIQLTNAHVTMVQDVDMIEGIYSCRWEGRLDSGTALVTNTGAQGAGGAAGSGETDAAAGL